MSIAKCLSGRILFKSSRKAAELGNVKAITNVGVMYEKGKGTAANYEKVGAQHGARPSPLITRSLLRKVQNYLHAFVLDFRDVLLAMMFRMQKGS